MLAFFFARGFVATGLGERVATLFVKFFGGSPLGLAYGLAVSEALVAPAMPSTTARAGGIYVPLVDALARQFGSAPLREDPSGVKAKRLGQFLTLSQLHSSTASACLGMTAAAQNLLALRLADELGVTEFAGGRFVAWTVASCVPALAAVAVTPLLVFYLAPPTVRDTRGAPALARRLAEMGPLSRDERLVVLTMGATVLLWACGDALGVQRSSPRCSASRRSCCSAS